MDDNGSRSTKGVRSTTSGGGSTLVHIFGVFPQLRIALDRIGEVGTADPEIEEDLEHLAIPRIWRKWIKIDKWQFQVVEGRRLDITIGGDVVSRIRDINTRHPSEWIEELQRDMLTILTREARMQKTAIMVRFHCPNCPEYVVQAEWGTVGLRHQSGCGALLEQDNPDNWTAFVPTKQTQVAYPAPAPSAPAPAIIPEQYGNCQCCGAVLHNVSTGIVGMVWSNDAHAWVVEYSAKSVGNASGHEPKITLLLCRTCADKFEGTVYVPKDGINGLRQCSNCFRPCTGLVHVYHGAEKLDVCIHCAGILTNIGEWDREEDRAKCIPRPSLVKDGINFVWEGITYVVGITALYLPFILLRNGTTLKNITWLSTWPPRLSRAQDACVRMISGPGYTGSAAKVLKAAIAVPVSEKETV